MNISGGKFPQLIQNLVQNSGLVGYYKLFIVFIFRACIFFIKIKMYAKMYHHGYENRLYKSVIIIPLMEVKRL